MGTVLVAERDKILLSKGYGFANVEWKIPQQPDAEFHLASVSKQFTAAAVMMPCCTESPIKPEWGVASERHSAYRRA